MVDVAGNTVAPSGRLWAFASYSRFVRPGAVRIGASTTDAGLAVSAFRNRTGSIAVVVLNRAHSRQIASVAFRGVDAARVAPFLTDASHGLSPQPLIRGRSDAFTAILPPRSLVSYEIQS